MSPVKITREMLLRALTAEIKRQSFGLAKIEVTSVFGVIKTGESFEIESLELSVAPTKTPAEPAERQFSPPAGAGKIKLATINGVSIA